MRITRDTLFALAKTGTAELAKKDRSVICIYLTGSLLGDDAILAGTADIDLVCVHTGRTSDAPREVQRISDEVTLDIAHYPDSLFQQPRQLRVNGWLGSFLWQGVKPLYDSQHWFEFMQASACAQFMSPENILSRARSLAIHARDYWKELEENPPESLSNGMAIYYQALEDTGNAIASLSGTPLTLRRFWQQLPRRATAVGSPELAGDLQRLVSVYFPEDAVWQTWFKQWVGVLDTIGKQAKCPAELQPYRKKYYTEAAAWLHNDDPLSALWILIRTELKAGVAARANSPVHKILAKMAEEWGFAGQGFTEKLTGLDQALDKLESLLESFAHQNGLEL